MADVVCPKCGYEDVGLVKKQIIGPGKFHRSWRCPRCSHTWETKDK